MNSHLSAFWKTLVARSWSNTNNIFEYHVQNTRRSVALSWKRPCAYPIQGFSPASVGCPLLREYPDHSFTFNFVFLLFGSNLALFSPALFFNLTEQRGLFTKGKRWLKIVGTEVASCREDLTVPQQLSLKEKAFQHLLLDSLRSKGQQSMHGGAR